MKMHISLGDRASFGQFVGIQTDSFFTITTKIVNLKLAAKFLYARRGPVLVGAKLQKQIIKG